MELDDVAIDFPDLTIIMAHGGRPLWMDEAFFVLRRHPNVYLDVSGIPPRSCWSISRAWRRSRTGKMVWGTDWPSPGVKDLRQNLDQFLALPLDADLQRAILCDNSARLFPDR